MPYCPTDDLQKALVTQRPDNSEAPMKRTRYSDAVLRVIMSSYLTTIKLSEFITAVASYKAKMCQRRGSQTLSCKESFRVILRKALVSR